MEEENIIEAVIGMNDHPSISFNFDTHNFHSQDTIWFLDSVSFDGVRQEGVPDSFYDDIIKFCESKIAKRGTVV